uniref:THUMP domain containing 3 [Chinchilla lanigera] n=1 Tax=Lepeophtheirus salmonis TaxID=72036 RepID=A0A0K2V2H8_LEPSM
MALPLDLPLSEIQGLREDVPQGYVTIEATSVTGFEGATKMEIEDRFSNILSGPVVKRQGRILFDFPLEQVERLPQELRTVDNVYLLIALESGIPFQSQSTV